MNYELLQQFSQTLPYQKNSFNELWTLLEEARVKGNFPALKPDIGFFLQWLLPLIKPKKIFEFGSGYGHSAYWYFSERYMPEQVVLTERRDDLEEIFHQLPWPEAWKKRMKYYRADAWEIWKTEPTADFILLDGEKASYLPWLKGLTQDLKTNSYVLIDNSFWKGSFLMNDANQTKSSAEAIKNLHQYLKESHEWHSCFIPFADGLSLLRKV